VPDDLLGGCLREFGGRPDFVLLDSAGHMGHIEFAYLLSQLTGPCHIALDDIRHIKHHRSFRQIQSNPRFELLVSSNEKFGFCLANYAAEEAGSISPVTPSSVPTPSATLSSPPGVAACPGKYPAAKTPCSAGNMSELYLACPHVETVICFDWQRRRRTKRTRRHHRIAAFQPDLVLTDLVTRTGDRIAGALPPCPAGVGMEGDLSNISKGDKQSLDRHYTRLISSPRTQARARAASRFPPASAFASGS
jgi:hypothetical protein